MVVVEGQSQDLTMMNGGSVLAMAGDGCVALAVDQRFGSGPQMVHVAPRHVLIPHAKLMVAFTGMEGDIQSLSQDLSVHLLSHAQPQSQSRASVISSSQIMSPKAMSTLTSHVLYGRRQSPYYVEPLIVGLEKVTNQQRIRHAQQQDDHDTDHDTIHNEPSSDDSSKNSFNNSKHCHYYRPFLCAQDVIGAQSKSDAFCCAGVASKSLYGTAEALWRPHLSPDELRHICGKAFLSALERDCLSGYGAILYLMTSDGGIVQYELACRND
jgi:20S proteasome subunit beta 3